MTAIAFGLGWLGYSFSLWGYCLVRGYDVKLSDLLNPVHPYQWPAGGIAATPLIPKGQLWPTGTASGDTAATSKPKPGSGPRPA